MVKYWPIVYIRKSTTQIYAQHIIPLEVSARIHLLWKRHAFLIISQGWGWLSNLLLGWKWKEICLRRILLKTIRMASNSWRQPLSIPAPEERGSLVEGEAKAKRKKACKTLKNYAKFGKRKNTAKSCVQKSVVNFQVEWFWRSWFKYEISRSLQAPNFAVENFWPEYMGNAPICKLFETQEKIISSLLIAIAFVKSCCCYFLVCWVFLRSKLNYLKTQRVPTRTTVSGVIYKLVFFRHYFWRKKTYLNAGPFSAGRKEVK